MSDNLPAPIASGAVLATKDIGGIHHPKNLLTDHAGADVLGLVTASPAPTTFLGRLKAAVDALLDLAPASSAFAITPSDTTVIATRSVFVGGAGSIVATIGGQDVTFAVVPAGATLPIKATKIKAASTATSIVGLA